MKGRTTKLSGAADAAATATATAPHTSCGRSSSESNEDSFPVISSANQQTSSSPENATSESASTVQIPPSQETSPSTPRTPTTPPEHGTNIPNPPTPGNTTSGNLVAPNYVTVTEAASSRSYASLTPVNPAGVESDPVNEEVGDNSAYVTYVEGNADIADHNSLYAAAAAAAAAATTNGQTLPYPVYTVGDNTMYGANTAQYYAANASNPGITYAQENGVTYLVSPTNNNNNANSTNSNLEIDGQPNLSHATRVSPATDKDPDSQSKRSPQETQRESNWFENLDEEGMDEDTDDEAEQEEFILSGMDPRDRIHGVAEDSVLMIGRADINRLVDGDLSVFAAPGALNTLQSCPLTVQWLMDNYETAEGVSLPRSTLYNHYIRHCTEHKLDPVNAASFGKLIRSVFLGLRTRRLGTRGNSKYHYYGIRLKPDSILNHFVETPSHHASGGNNRHNNNSMNSGHMAKRLKTSKSEHFEVSQHINGISMNEAMAIQQYLGDSSRALDDFPTLNFALDLPDGLGQDDIIIFRSVYREHCEALLEDVVNFQLSDVDRRWRVFWRSGDLSPNNAELIEFENVLPYAKLHALCRMKEVQQFVRDSDYQFYQNIVGILMPDVLRPIPSSMTQAIRNFAKTLEGCLAGAMHGFPEEMVSMKLNVVNALAQTLRRYTSLNHLAQAARAVLQNQTQINQMLSDLNRVDFHNVEEQASWVCGCNGDLVPDLEADFKATLGQQQTLEQWATWLEGVVDRILSPHVNSPKFVQAARHFILKWSFYSSLVIRDLTLRSAASFGSFHLLRLLYDEYMFFLVEHRVAQVTGIVPIAVIGKKSFDGVPFDPSMDSADEDDVQTEAAVSRYLNEHHQAPSVSHTQNVVVNGISNSVSSMLPSTGETLEASSTPTHPLSSDMGPISPTHDIVKSEFKQRVKNFLTV